MDLLRIASLVLDRPHHITPEAAALVLGVLADRAGIEEIVSTRRQYPASSGFIGRRVLDKDTGAAKGYRITEKGAAIIPVHGELVNRGAWVGASSGLVSYEGLRHSLKNAAADPAVKSIVLDVDSPGGMATGMLETGALVAEVAAVKPVVAVGDGLMASAAYGISAGATRIIAADSGAIGSIGTVWMHADRSRQVERMGITVTLIHAGAKKVDGTSFRPLPESVREERQALLNRMQGDFIAHVAAGRRMSDKDVRGTEAAVFLGRDAVALGLADSVGTSSDAVAEAEAMSPRRTVVSVPPNRPAPPPPPVQPAAARSGILKGKAMDVVHGEPGAGAPGNGWEGMTLAQMNEAVAAMRESLSLAPSVAHQATGAAMTGTTAQAAPSLVVSAGAERAPEAPAAETPAAAYARGRSEATARIAAILGHAEATERQAQARVIALESDMAVDQAARLLAAAPKETTGGGTTLAAYRAAVAATANPNVPHVGGAEDRTAQVAGSADFRERSKARAESRFGRPGAALRRG